MKPLSLEIHGAKFVKTPKTKSGCVEKQELELDLKSRLICGLSVAHFC